MSEYKKMKYKTGFHNKAEFSRAEMRVSRIAANKAKIPLQAATCAALAAHPGDAGGTGDPGESLNK